ncbi:MAG: 50S ribosomal protein L24 [Burkholderiales bacterium]|jgi:large subunit ribosomal protein L24|nr:50S ribosomal protein L24 [Burkholderiales bacterium]
MRKIRKGDQVVVITGRDKGKRGSVDRVIDDQYLLVAGVNQYKRHTRPNPMKNEAGGILVKEMPIHISNVAIWNAATQKPDRIGFRFEGEGESKRKVRFFKSNNEALGN